MEGLGTDSMGCESVLIGGGNVGGQDKMICVSQETGVSLSELMAHNTEAYALFFCGTQDNEPTCVPSRPGEYTGVLSAADLDGDGVGDVCDPNSRSNTLIGT